jgi:hypothetical protein
LPCEFLNKDNINAIYLENQGFAEI